MPNKHGQPVIAIDGTSASGKSTLSERLASDLGARRIEYSLFFRLIALHMIERGFTPTPGQPAPAESIAAAARYAATLTDWQTIETLQRTHRDALRTVEVSRVSPYFSGEESVLHSTDTTMRTLIDASFDKPVIAEGRTIAKYVYPDSDVKLYVDAAIEKRAERRHASLSAKWDERERNGETPKRESVASVSDDLLARDTKDQTRLYQPTGFDASVHTKLDTSDHSIDETLELAKSLINTAVPALASRANTPHRSTI